MASIVKRLNKKSRKKKLQRSQTIKNDLENTKNQSQFKGLGYYSFNHVSYGTGGIRFVFLSEKSNKLFWKKIDSSEPTDIVMIHSKVESNVLTRKWNENIYKNFHIPANIFFNKTIPLNDFIIRYDVHKNNEKFYISFRCIIFENVLFKSDNSVCCGAIIADFDLSDEKSEVLLECVHTSESIIITNNTKPE